jgi:hypothetical protein
MLGGQNHNCLVDLFLETAKMFKELTLPFAEGI